MVHYVRLESRKRLLAGDMPAWIANSPRRDYIASVVRSAPPWVDRRALYELSGRAATLTARTGELHVLDHVIPLNHPRVCGLTVPWNLRVIHWRANLSKGNSWCPEQADLFDGPPGQMELFACEP